MPPLDFDSLAALLTHPVVAAVGQLAGPGRAHLVGGSVRDALLGRPVGDFDLVVSGDGERLAQRLAERLGGRLVRLGGERFAAFRVVLADGLSLDLWDREHQSLAADLARRDLTINAIALELPGGSRLDPFGGLADLAARRLVATTPRSFSDDPLRVLRLARFAAELPGFRAVTPTLLLAKNSAGQLSDVASERIRYELERVFGVPAGQLGTARGVAILAHIHVFPGLWQGRPGESSSHLGTPAKLARLTRIEAAFLRRLPSERPNVAPARWALSFASLAAVDAGVLTRFVDRGYLLPRLHRLIERLLAGCALPASLLEARRFLDHWRQGWAAATVYAWARESDSHNSIECRSRFEILAATLELHGAELLAPVRLVSGEEVQSLLGIAPGPAVGKALEQVRRAQVDGLVRTKDEALQWLRPVS